jgi:DNA-directed RNA polymerase specialized sigma24 family protein
MAARIDWVEQRLMRWALAVTQGLDGSGYPAVNVLDSSWSPPTPGQTPTLKVAASGDDVMGTHRALAQLSMRARNTVAVHYCMRLPLAEQAERLECAVQTVHQRVVAVHRDLARILGESQKEFCNKEKVG